jgi:hypothetical protein
LRRLSGWLLTLLLLSSLTPRQSDGQDVGISARHNAWARFQSGAWKLVRVSTETLDDSGRVVSTNVTETKTSLTKLEGECVVLEVEVGVEIAGKQFDGLPQCVKQGFHGELCGGDVKLQPSTTAELTIEDRKIECRRQQIEINTSAGTTSVNLCYSDSLAPFILRRESKTTDTASKVINETLSEVVALDMPQRVLTEIKNVSCIKTVQKSAKGTVTTLAMSSPDVPGGVVSQTTKEMDPAGRLVRRSTLEVVSFGTRPEKERTGLFGRKRGARARKTMIYPDGTWQK